MVGSRQMMRTAAHLVLMGIMVPNRIKRSTRQLYSPGKLIVQYNRSEHALFTTAVLNDAHAHSGVDLADVERKVAAKGRHEADAPPHPGATGRDGGLSGHPEHRLPAVAPLANAGTPTFP